MTQASAPATEHRLHIGGFPDAVKMVALEGPIARQAAHYCLHLGDLGFAHACLNAINSTGEPHVQQALWRSAIIFYLKCFRGGGVRATSLDERVIYKGEPEGLVAFRYFDALRNKHFIHDENAYAQVDTCAAINDGSKPFKVEKILTIALVAETLEPANRSNLGLLVAKAIEWTAAKHEALCVVLTAELEALPIETLMAMEDAKGAIPDIADLEGRRTGF